MLGLLAAKPPVSDAAHRSATIPLALLRFIPLSWQPLSDPWTHILLIQLSPIILSVVAPASCCPPNPPSPTSPHRLNPHRARCTAGAPPPATSCLGASPTPTGSACGEPSISASEKPAQNAKASCGAQHIRS